MDVQTNPTTDPNEGKLYVLPVGQILPLHEITDAYADFSDDELGDLRRSLCEHGLLVPVAVWRGEIVDGRHRARLCRELGIALRCQDMTDEWANETEMVAGVQALNEHRRADTAPYTTVEKRVRIETALREHPERSDRQIAGALGVSPTTIGTARRRLATVQNGQLPKKRIGADGKERRLPTPRIADDNDVGVMVGTPGPRSPYQAPLALPGPQKPSETPTEAGDDRTAYKEVVAKWDRFWQQEPHRAPPPKSVPLWFFNSSEIDIACALVECFPRPRVRRILTALKAAMGET
jgi:hypothetical protein